MKEVIRKAFTGVLALFDIGIHRHSRAVRNDQQWLIDGHFKTVIDVGANSGQFAQSIHKILPKAVIHSFEPLNSVYPMLVEETKAIKNIVTYHCALGDKNEEVEMYENEYSLSSSLLQVDDIHKQNFPHAQKTVKTMAQVKRMDDVLSISSLEKPVLVKIDVQGFEDKVIDGANTIMTYADAAVIETSVVELYAGQPLFHAVYERMYALGFEYAGNQQQTNDFTNGKVLQFDALFYKRKSSN
jgi:FkbM family methyltransferase